MKSKKGIVTGAIIVLSLLTVITVKGLEIADKKDSPLLCSIDGGLLRESLEEGSTVADYTDSKTLGVFREFYTFDEYRELSFDVNATVSGGNAYLVIYDVTGVPYTQDTDKFKEVYRETISKDGDYKIDLLQFPRGRQYAIRYLCDEKCLFEMHDYMSWKISMKDYLLDKAYCEIAARDSQFDPYFEMKHQWCP